ncbi:MAG: hypothetical protein ACTS6G_04965 [Candidatus Hodgkinia cicadicola]
MALRGVQSFKYCALRRARKLDHCPRYLYEPKSLKSQRRAMETCLRQIVEESP